MPEYHFYEIGGDPGCKSNYKSALIDYNKITLSGELASSITVKRKSDKIVKHIEQKFKCLFLIPINKQVLKNWIR